MAVLTISRDLGSGGREVAQAISAALAYRFLDREEILAHIRAAGHKWEKWAEEFDEHSPRLWEKFDWSYRGFLALVQSTILNEATTGKVIVIGRGGNFLLKDIPFVLRLRVVAPLDVRIQRIADRESIDRDSAIWLLERTDRERAGFLYFAYGKNGKDPRDYDFVFDSGSTPIDEIVAIVEKILAEKDALQTDESLLTLRMKALAADIKAHLFTNVPFFMSTLDVEFSGGEISVRGVVRLPRERELITKIARNMAGEVPVKTEIRYRQ
jgi:cytidylate kinase